MNPPLPPDMGQIEPPEAPHMAIGSMITSHPPYSDHRNNHFMPTPVCRLPLWVYLLAAAMWLAPIGAGYALANWQCEAGR
jgi:hypothetical protein